jgi:hypothetical protein
MQNKKIEILFVSIEMIYNINSIECFKMSAQIVDTITIYQGAQCKYYIVKGKKYHIRFPMEWAHTQDSIKIEEEYEDKTGPVDCGNCDAYGSIRGIFIGYCSNCLQNYIEVEQPKGNLVVPGIPADMLTNNEMWERYPYMYGIKKSEIGDEEGAEIIDEELILEQLYEEMNMTDEEDRIHRQYAFCNARMDECFDVEEEEAGVGYAEEQLFAEDDSEY